MKETQAYTQTEPRLSFCKGDNVDEEITRLSGAAGRRSSEMLIAF